MGHKEDFSNVIKLSTRSTCVCLDLQSGVYCNLTAIKNWPQIVQVCKPIKLDKVGCKIFYYVCNKILSCNLSVLYILLNNLPISNPLSMRRPIPFTHVYPPIISFSTSFIPISYSNFPGQLYPVNSPLQQKNQTIISIPPPQRTLHNERLIYQTGFQGLHIHSSNVRGLEHGERGRCLLFFDRRQHLRDCFSVWTNDSKVWKTRTIRSIKRGY